MTKMTELLLTVLALSQEGYSGPLTAVIPPRLMGTWRAARAKGLVTSDDGGIYVDEAGSALLDAAGLSRPF